MFSYLKGVLIAASPSTAVIEVNGIGYDLSIHCRLMSELPLLGNEVKLFTSFVVREFSHTLYGFLHPQEKEVFEVLMNVTGIGPKLALSLIGHLTCSDLSHAVSKQDIPTLCRVPGVGKKTAERLIVELKDKLPSLVSSVADVATFVMNDPKTLLIQDAMLALINLGYNQNTAQKAVKQSLQQLPEETDLASLITTALKNV